MKSWQWSTSLKPARQIQQMRLPTPSPRQPCKPRTCLNQAQSPHLLIQAPRTSKCRPAALARQGSGVQCAGNLSALGNMPVRRTSNIQAMTLNMAPKVHRPKHPHLQSLRLVTAQSLKRRRYTPVKQVHVSRNTESLCVVGAESPQSCKPATFRVSSTLTLLPQSFTRRWKSSWAEVQDSQSPSCPGTTRASRTSWMG